MAWGGRPNGKRNLEATAAPTITDDISLGYEISSLWVDVTNDDAYICVDNTDGAAVWVEIGGGASINYSYDFSYSYNSMYEVMGVW